MTRLDKSMGLFDVFAIAAGAMISSGLFLLPGLAAAETGLSVSLAYLIAGVLMIPAMLSKAELATAMPKAGGTYYFLDRAMGPLVGTIGGLGTWVALIFKSGFALIGMGAYVALFLDVPILAVALVLTGVLCVANIVGAKESSRLQQGLVFVLLVAVGAFLLLGVEATGVGRVALKADQPFLIAGVDGLLATVGLVFVSYAGLTKVASVAEEVRDPDRNIPLGMILALGVATLAYTLCVTLMVLVLPAAEFHADLAPMATAAAALAGPWAGVAVAVTAVAAVAAFASTANAGILSASRYPLAMARDRLMPERFSQVGRFGTPTLGVVVTSAGIGLCILLLDITTVAKLASSFQLLLFGMVNLCVIVMREGRLEYYRPGFRSPLYPGLQLAGIVVPMWLIAEMGWVAMAFTAGLVVAASLWYWLYAASNVSRQGAIFHVFERLGRRRWAGLDDELRRILDDKGLRPDDPLGEILERVETIAADARTFDDVAADAATRFARHSRLDADELAEAFVAENRLGMMPVVGTTAFPHYQVLGIDEPDLVVVWVAGGVPLEQDPAEARAGPARAIDLFVFLLSPAGDAGQHYRLLAHLAGRVEEGIELLLSSDDRDRPPAEDGGGSYIPERPVRMGEITLDRTARFEPGRTTKPGKGA